MPFLVGGLGEELVGLPRGFYEIHFWTDEDVRTPVTFVCDEAHLYLQGQESPSDPGRFTYVSIKRLVDN